MSDPAVEAAQRAWTERYPNGSVLLASSAYQDGIGALAIAAAREALKPIRELHKPVYDNCIDACCSGEQCKHRSRLCSHCWEEWPCPDALNAYTSKELER